MQNYGNFAKKIVKTNYFIANGINGKIIRYYLMDNIIHYDSGIILEDN